MPKLDNASIETADMMRLAAQDERPQDRYAGRGKFTGCRQCGSVDGMQAVHRERLAEMTDAEIDALAPWYQYCESLTDDYLYYPCPMCNWPIVISNDSVAVSRDEVLTTWLDRDPMTPDYAALAREEPISQIKDSRDAAGLEE